MHRAMVAAAKSAIGLSWLAAVAAFAPRCAGVQEPARRKEPEGLKDEKGRTLLFGGFSPVFDASVLSLGSLFLASCRAGSWSPAEGSPYAFSVVTG